MITLAPNTARLGVVLTLAGGGVPVRGSVNDAAGGPIESAWVTAMPPVADATNIRPGPGWTTRTDAEGRFEVWVEPTRVALWVEADGYSPARLMAGAPAAALRIELLPEAVIEGSTVWANSGEFVGGALVVASGRGGSGRAYSDKDGRFRIDRLAPGRYSVMAVTERGRGRAPASVAVHIGEHAVTKVELVSASLVRGRVLLIEDDTPCERGEVHLLDMGAHLNTRTSEIGTDGGVSFHGVGPGDYEVDITCDGRLPPIDAPTLTLGVESPELQIWRVRRGASVRGQVIDNEGNPVPDVLTSASPVGEHARARAQAATTDEAGVFVLNGLAPGEYAITPWWGHWIGAGSSERVEVVEDETESPALVLPAGGRVVGRVHDESNRPLVDIPIQAVSVGISPPRLVAGHTGPAGRFAIGDLPPGPYFISAGPGTGFGTDPAQSTVDVESGLEVSIDVVASSRRGVIRGLVVDDTGSPADDILVYAREDGWIGLSEPARALTDGEGRFVVEGLAQRGYVVWATRNETTLAQTRVEAGASDVKLELAATGELAGRVRLPEGAAAPFDIWLKGPSDFHYGSFENLQNRWAFSDLPPGEYRVTVECEAGTGDTTAQVEEGGRTDLTIDVVTRGRVEGQILDAVTREPVAGVVVRVPLKSGVGVYRGHGSSGTQDVTGADGKFGVSAPAGEVTLSVRPPSHLRTRYRAMSTLESEVLPGSVSDLGVVLLD